MELKLALRVGPDYLAYEIPRQEQLNIRRGDWLAAAEHAARQLTQAQHALLNAHRVPVRRHMNAAPGTVVEMAVPLLCEFHGVVAFAHRLEAEDTLRVR